MRRQRRWSVKLLALLGAFSLIAASCGDDSDDGSEDATTEAESESPEERYTGGDLILGAEQWPVCINPITTCETMAWHRWGITQHVLPGLMEMSPDSEYVPSPLLDGEPELTGEGTEDGPEDEPFRVTFNLNPDAVWDDGSPITSSDVRFTWLARMNTSGVSTLTGWEDIVEVDDSDPQVAVMEFGRPYASWEVLGGGAGLGSSLIQRSYFEQFEGETVEDQIVEVDPDTGEEEVEEVEVEGFDMEAPDVSAHMIDEIPFSGGPFQLESWSQDEHVLVPNDNYWAEERTPRVDTITFVPQTDHSSAVAALRANDVHALSPQPNIGLESEIGDMEMEIAISGSHEGLRFTYDSRGPGLEDSPVNELEVRQAMLYGIDRDAIVEELMVPEYPETEVNHCADWTIVPTDGMWCEESNQLFDVGYDPGRAAELLDEAGWELDGDVRVKDGQALSVTLSTTSGNQRREDSQLRIREYLEDLGFEVEVDNPDAGQYFGLVTPQREFDVGLWAWVAGPDPSPRARFACDEIPTEDNSFAGSNFHNFCMEEVDELIDQQDEAVVDEERQEIIEEIHEYLFEDVVVIPLFAMPNVTVWDPDEAVPNHDVLGTQDSSYGYLWDWGTP